MTEEMGKAIHRARRAMMGAYLASAFIVFIGCGAGCSSMSLRDQAAVDVLNTQTEVLDKLAIERADPRVARKVNADPDLKRAEEHLQLVIEMMKRSNESVKNSF